MTKPTLRVLGIRGVPARHGGFETFAENLAQFLLSRGWRVVVYCQEDGDGPPIEDQWQGVERVRIPVTQDGPVGTIVFDWKATLHARRCQDVCLVLGYNTAIFCLLLRLRGIPTLLNMDGLEWLRGKWGRAEKAWFYANDWLGCWIATHLVADHPKIEEHLATRVSRRKISMIPYGADNVEAAPTEPVTALGLAPNRYMTVIARAEPENSLLEIVKAFSSKKRGCILAVLGDYDEDHYAYHRAVKDAASEEVRFFGSIYDKAVLHPLRFHSLAYIHGHTVGGTNPSLVEALGAANAILARDNPFNRWVAGSAARYFDSIESCSDEIDRLLSSPELAQTMRAESKKQFADRFKWGQVLLQYESLIERFLQGRGSVRAGEAPPMFGPNVG